jgi:hypothetical protein
MDGDVSLTDTSGTSEAISVGELSLSQVDVSMDEGYPPPVYFIEEAKGTQTVDADLTSTDPALDSILHMDASLLDDLLAMVRDDDGAPSAGAKLNLDASSRSTGTSAETSTERISENSLLRAPVPAETKTPRASTRTQEPVTALDANTGPRKYYGGLVTPLRTSPVTEDDATLFAEAFHIGKKQAGNIPEDPNATPGFSFRD